MKAVYIFLFFILHSSLIAQTWQQQPNFPGLERDDAVAVTIGNTAYYGIGFAVGFTCMNDWWSFDEVNGWQQKASFQGLPRQYAAAASLGKYVYIFGGIDQNVISLNDFWRYDSENDSWENLSSLPSIGRQAPVIIPLEDKLLVGMGRNNITYFSDFWLYDPNTNSFEEVASIPTTGRYYPIAQNVGGNAVVAHGWNQTECFNDAWRYDEIFDLWIQMSDSPSEGCNYVASSVVENKLIIGGGKNYSNDFLNEYFEFDISTNTWKSLPDLPSVPRKGAAMFTLDEEVYLVNGIDTSFTRLKEVWKLSFPEEENPKMEISPNPVTNWLNIYLEEEMRNICSTEVIISLYDLSGKLVIQENYTTEGFGLWFPINLNSLQSGMYILKLEDCEGLESVKVVKE